MAERFEDDDVTMPCPYCGKAIYDDAERCPYCENYVSREDAPSKQPVWLVIGVVICLAIIALWILGR
jgi:hypothetical protein